MNPERRVIRFRRSDGFHIRGNPLPQRKNLLRERLNRQRELQPGDIRVADGQPVSHRTAPFLRNTAGIQDSQNRPCRRRGAIGIHPAIRRIADCLPEIASAGKKCKHGKRNIDAHTHLEFRRIPVVKSVPDEPPVPMGIPKRTRRADPLRQNRVRRKIGKPGFNEFANVRLDKRHRLQCGKKDLGVHSASGMVNTGVLASELHRQCGIPRRKTRPNFAPDRRPHPVGIIIVIRPRPRRADSQCKVAHRHGIFLTMEIHMPEPDVRKDFPVDLRFLHTGQRCGIHHLKLKIIIRNGSGRHRVVIRQPVHGREAFKRRPQRTSYVFSIPAGKHPFPVSTQFVHKTHLLSFNSVKCSIFTRR